MKFTDSVHVIQFNVNEFTYPHTIHKDIEELDVTRYALYYITFISNHIHNNLSYC